MTIQRNPGESLVSFYNRRLRAKGDETREWYEDRMGTLRIRDRVPPQSKLELGE